MRYSRTHAQLDRFVSGHAFEACRTAAQKLGLQPLKISLSTQSGRNQRLKPTVC